MKNVFVETSNVKRFQSALSAMEERGAEESCLMVIEGEPGLGKTTALQNWVAKTGSLYIRAKKEWQPGWFLNEMLTALRIHPPHSIEKKFAAALEELSRRSRSASMSRGIYGLVIDEADHISKKAAVLETIRDLTDMIGLPTILVGMGKVNNDLKRFPQIDSRVSQKIWFSKATKDDVRAFVDQRCEISVADDLVDFILRVTGGYNREILEAIANIERFGLRMDLDGSPIRLSDMAGMVIVNNRGSIQPIVVPETV